MIVAKANLQLRHPALLRTESVMLSTCRRKDGQTFGATAEIETGFTCSRDAVATVLTEGAAAIFPAPAQTGEISGGNIVCVRREKGLRTVLMEKETRSMDPSVAEKDGHFCEIWHSSLEAGEFLDGHPSMQLV